MNKVMIYLIYFSIYSLGLIFVGKGGLKKTETIEDFFIGGTEIGLLASILTYTATWFSVASIQGFTGSVYSSGYEVILYSVVGWFFGAGLLILLVDPLKAYNLISIPSYFYERYDSKKLQIFGGVVMIFCYILYIIIQITGFGFVMTKLLAIDYKVSLLLIYLFIVYTTYGGFFSVAKTDGYNILITIASVAITSVLVLSRFDSFEVINRMAAALDNPGGSVVEINASFTMLFSTAFAWGIGLSANPQYLIRISSAKDAITAKKMIAYATFVLGGMYLLLTLIGMGGRVLQPDLTVTQSVDAVYANLIHETIYSPFSGLILIGMAAAAISTINSQLLLISSSLMIDIVSVLGKKALSTERVLTYSRMTIIVAATISLYLSLSPPGSLLIYGSYVWAVFSVTFFLPLYGGVFWDKANIHGVKASIIAGLLVMGLALLRSGLSTEVRLWHPVIPSFTVATVCFVLFSLRGEKNHDSAGY